MEEVDAKTIEDRAKKQLYLKQNIAEKGYDKEEFARFMNIIKSNSSDIDLWSFEELKEIVSEFQKDQEPVLSIQRSFDDSDEPYKYPDSPGSERYDIKENNDIHNMTPEEAKFRKDIDNKCLSPSEKENNNDIESHDSPDNKGDSEASIPHKKQKLLDFEDSVKISDKTAISKTSGVVVEIIDVVFNPGGLFSFSSTDYIVETHPFGWNVSRKEQDFKRLRDYMLKKFPQFVIPPLLQAKLLHAQADNETKKVYFQEFLREILSNPEL